MADAPRDNNHVPAALFEIDGLAGQVMPGQIDVVTGRILVEGGGSSGSTLAYETPTGTVNDSNVTFIVLHEPLYIVVNGLAFTVGTGQYSSYLAGTITLSSAVGTGGFITSFYQ